MKNNLSECYIDYISTIIPNKQDKEDLLLQPKYPNTPDLLWVRGEDFFCQKISKAVDEPNTQNIIGEHSVLLRLFQLNGANNNLSRLNCDAGYCPTPVTLNLHVTLTENSYNVSHRLYLWLNVISDVHTSVVQCTTCQK